MRRLADNGQVDFPREVVRKLLPEAKQSESRINVCSSPEHGKAPSELLGCHWILYQELVADSSVAVAGCDARKNNLPRHSGRQQQVLAMIKRRWSIIGGNAKSDAAFQWRGILIPVVKKTTTLGK
jgi:hypothetical protein